MPRYWLNVIEHPNLRPGRGCVFLCLRSVPFSVFRDGVPLRGGNPFFNVRKDQVETFPHCPHGARFSPLPRPPSPTPQASAGKCESFVVIKGLPPRP